MYFMETTANALIHTMDSFWFELGLGGGGYFCRFHLTIMKSTVSVDKKTITVEEIIRNKLLFCRNKYLDTP
jgi:hypothetical protein